MSVWEDADHDAWYRLGARMGDLVEMLSGREDLIVRISPDLRTTEERQAAPIPAAFFTPAQARTSFNASAVLREGIDDPDIIDPCDNRDQARHPELIGAAIHESAHAAHTRLSFPSSTTPEAVKWTTLLEETRCEKRALERRPHDASMLRISTHTLVANGALRGDFSSDDASMEREVATRASLLLLARVDNGVLEEHDVAALQERVIESLGIDLFEAMRAIWRNAQDLQDEQRADLIALGQSIQDLLDEVSSSEVAENESDESSEGESSEDESSEGESSEGQSSEGQSSEGESSEDESSEGESSEGESSEGQSSEGQSSEGQSSEGESSEGQPSEGQPSEDTDNARGEGNPQPENSDPTDDAFSDATNKATEESCDERIPSQRATPGGARPEDSEPHGSDSNEDEASDPAGGSGSREPDGSKPEDSQPGMTEAVQDQNGSDGMNKSPESEAYRMPCGSWTEGNLPEGAQDAVPAPQGEQNPIERTASQGTEEGASEARRDIAAAAGIFVLPTDDTRQERAAERAEASAVSRSVFAQQGGTRSVRITVRSVAPDANAQRMARQLGQAIKAAQYRDVVRTRIRSQTPPGRLNIREAASRAAQVSRGERTTATPWTQTRRRLIENPPLIVGIATDVSASMDSWQRPVSTFAWSLSKAIRDLSGTVAVTAWNGTNTAIMHPGRGSNDLKIISCGGGSSACPQALDALDGVLNLCDSDGVRVAVVVTDGRLPNMEDIQKKADRLKRYGVILLWIITDRRGVEVQGAVNIRVNDASTFANVVGQHLTRALSVA